MAVFLAAIYISAFYGDQIIQAFTSALYRANSHFNWNRYINLGRFFSYQYIAVGVAMAVYWKMAFRVLARLPLLYFLAVVALIVLFPLITSLELKALYRYFYPILLASIVGWVIVKPEYVGFLRWRVIQFIGACSYSSYLWQQLFTGGPERYGSIRLANPFIALPLLILCAAASHYFIEQKFIALGKRFRPAKLAQPTGD